MMKKESWVKVAALSQNPSYVTLIKKFFFVNIMSSFLKISVLEFCQRNLYQGLLYLHPHQISHQCTFDASKTLAAFPNAKLDDCQRKFFNVIMGSLFFRDGIFFVLSKKVPAFDFSFYFRWSFRRVFSPWSLWEVSRCATAPELPVNPID